MSEKNLEIVRGIAQAAANAYDGATDENGEFIKIGLRREDGPGPVKSIARTMDGFKCRIDGNHLLVTYQSDIKLRDVYDKKRKNFEGRMEERMSSIAKWLKKEYKRITGNTLSLSPVDEIDILVQSTSRVRVFVTANQKYKIGGLEGVEDKLGPSEEKIEKKFREFLGLGDLGKRPPNKNQRA